jgi:predicted nucleic acid-binding protein
VILADTSVWIDHLRRRDPLLAAALQEGEIAGHPFVLGELACGRLQRRDEILSLFAALPEVMVADHEEVLAFVARHALGGRGIGWVDAHLLAAAALSRVPLWTRDRELSAVARALGLAAPQA